jgi:hypothetical protein
MMTAAVPLKSCGEIVTLEIFRLMAAGFQRPKPEFAQKSGNCRGF